MITETVSKTHEVRIGRVMFRIHRLDNSISGTATFSQSDNDPGQPPADERDEQTIEANFAEIMALPGAVAFQTAFKDFCYAKRAAQIAAEAGA